MANLANMVGSRDTPRNLSSFEMGATWRNTSSGCSGGKKSAAFARRPGRAGPDNSSCLIVISPSSVFMSCSCISVVGVGIGVLFSSEDEMEITECDILVVPDAVW